MSADSGFLGPWGRVDLSADPRMGVPRVGRQKLGQKQGLKQLTSALSGGESSPVISSDSGLLGP